MRDAEGRVRCIAGSVSDIDSRKRNEEALRLSEERYAIASAGSHEGHWVWDLATNDVHTSRFLNELFDQPPETEVVNIDRFFSRWPVHADDRPGLDAQIADHLAGKMPGNRNGSRPSKPKSRCTRQRWSTSGARTQTKPPSAV